MFSALVKKQLMEINSYLFQNRKTGKLHSKKQIIWVSIAYVLLFAFIGVSLFFVVGNLCKAFAEADMLWLYFSFVGLMSLAFGVFGSVFNTYASLYRAKDNDLLLSMPIPPYKILAARIIGVFTSALLYESVVYIPALIARFIYAPVTLGGVISSILLWAVMGVLITFFTLILGWVVAAISARLKNKTFITVILFILFFGLYYYFIFQAGNYISGIIAASEDIGNAFKSWVFPVYCFGIAAEGNPLAFVGFTLATAALFLITMFIMSKTFIKITTGAKSANKVKYKEKPVKVKTPSRALLYRETKRLFSNATVLLNSSASFIVGLFGGIMFLVNSGTLNNAIESAGENAATIKTVMIVIGVTMCFMCAAMNNICGPSVSLEAKTIDITRSLPVKTRDLLLAKQKLHIIMTLLPVLFLSVCLAVSFKMDAFLAAVFIISSAIFVFYGSAFSLTMGLKFPNLKWTNETVAVKQGAGNMINVFGGMVLSLVVGGGTFLFSLLMPVAYGLIIFGVIFATIAALLNIWIFRKGVKIFEEL